MFICSLEICPLFVAVLLWNWTLWWTIWVLSCLLLAVVAELSSESWFKLRTNLFRLGISFSYLFADAKHLLTCRSKYMADLNSIDSHTWSRAELNCQISTYCLNGFTVFMLVQFLIKFWKIFLVSSVITSYPSCVCTVISCIMSWLRTNHSCNCNTWCANIYH